MRSVTSAGSPTGSQVPETGGSEWLLGMLTGCCLRGTTSGNDPTGFIPRGHCCRWNGTLENDSKSIPRVRLGFRLNFALLTAPSRCCSSATAASPDPLAGFSPNSARSLHGKKGTRWFLIPSHRSNSPTMNGALASCLVLSNIFVCSSRGIYSSD